MILNYTNIYKGISLIYFMLNETDGKEQKIQRIVVTKDCSRCGKKIIGTSRKHLKHNYGMHIIFCSLKNKKKNDKQ